MINRTDFPKQATPGSHTQIQPVLSIVMPVYNEASLLPTVVPDLFNELKSRGMAFEILICENGSTDTTNATARRIVSELSHRSGKLNNAAGDQDSFNDTPDSTDRGLNRIRVLSLEKADYGAAIRAGILEAKTPYVFLFDIDYYDMGFLEKAMALLKNYDIVIASKLASGADDRRGPVRRAITRGFSLFNRLLFNSSISETHGMKALRREALKPIVDVTHSNKDLFDTELIIRAERAGFKIIEIPVTVEEQRPTRSSVAKRIPRTVAGLFKLRYALWREGSQ